MMINERLGKSEHHVKHLNATNHHLDDFAVKGLRTLNYAYKDISNKEYDEWKKEYKIAETAIIEREVSNNQYLVTGFFIFCQNFATFDDFSKWSATELSVKL